MSNTQAAALPEGYTIVRLHELPAAEQRAAIETVFAFMEKSYPSFHGAEVELAAKDDLTGPESWAKQVYAAGKTEGTRLLGSLIYDQDGNLASVTTAQIYDKALFANNTLINYTLGNENDSNYETLYGAAKSDVIRTLQDLQGAGEQIGLVLQEHMQQKEAHAPKIRASKVAGQVDLKNAPEGSTLPGFGDAVLLIWPGDHPVDDITAYNPFLAPVVPNNGWSFDANWELLHDGYASYLQDGRFAPAENPGVVKAMEWVGSLPEGIIMERVYAEFGGDKNRLVYPRAAAPAPQSGAAPASVAQPK